MAKRSGSGERALMALSEVGVEIGPLLAGAGIVVAEVARVGEGDRPRADPPPEVAGTVPLQPRGAEAAGAQQHQVPVRQIEPLGMRARQMQRRGGRFLDDAGRGPVGGVAGYPAAGPLIQRMDT